MKASGIIKYPFNRRRAIPERLEKLETVAPGDITTFQKDFNWALQNPNLSDVVAGIPNMEMAK